MYAAAGLCLERCTTVTCLPLEEALLLPGLSGLPTPEAVSCYMPTSRLSCLALGAGYSIQLDPQKLVFTFLAMHLLHILKLKLVQILEER